MRNAFTLRQIANLISTVEHRSADDENRLHQRLRGWYQAKLLTPFPTDDAGETVAKQFGIYEVCRARLLLVLREKFGIDGDDLKRLDAYMGKEETDTLPDGRHIHTGLRAGVEGIQKGQSWTLEFTISRDDETGEEAAYCRFVRDKQTRDPTGQDWMLLGQTVIAYVQISATAILRPLLLAAAKD